MNSDIKQFVPLEEVTAEAMTIIKGATAADRLLMKQWAWRGLKEIGPGKQNIKDCDIEVIDYRAKKPQDYADGIDLALYSGSTEVLHDFKFSGGRIHSPRNSAAASGEYNPQLNALVDVSEDPYYFHLSSNGNTVSTIKLKYFAFPIDGDGFPLVPHTHVFAIIMFIRYMWEMRQNENRSAIEQNRNAWLIERASAKGRNKMPSMLEGKAIAKNWMSMIDKPFFDNF